MKINLKSGWSMAGEVNQNMKGKTEIMGNSIPMFKNYHSLRIINQQDKTNFYKTNLPFQKKILPLHLLLKPVVV
jgi:hypothetical protein